MDTSNGVFTAPVSGVWSFTFSGLVKLTKGGNYGLQMEKNGKTFGDLYRRDKSGYKTYGTVSMTAMIHLKVGTYAA